MALFPQMSERGRAAVVLAAAIAAAFGVIVSVLRGDWVMATIIAVAAALLVVVWTWSRGGPEGE